MNERFARRLLGALGVASPTEVHYRRAVPTEARSGLAPPADPVRGLVLAGGRVAVLDPAAFPDGRLTEGAVDAALHAARTAGAEWVAVVSRGDQDLAVLRALRFLPLAGAADAS